MPISNCTGCGRDTEAISGLCAACDGHEHDTKQEAEEPEDNTTDQPSRDEEVRQYVQDVMKEATE